MIVAGNHEGGEGLESGELLLLEHLEMFKWPDRR